MEGCDALGITHEVKQSLLVLFEKNRSLMCEQENNENFNDPNELNEPNNINDSYDPNDPNEQ